MEGPGSDSAIGISKNLSRNTVMREENCVNWIKAFPTILYVGLAVTLIRRLYLRVQFFVQILKYRTTRVRFLFCAAKCYRQKSN